MNRRHFQKLIAAASMLNLVAPSTSRAQANVKRHHVGMLIDPDMIMLDLTGPLTSFNIMQADVQLVAKTSGPVLTDQRLKFCPEILRDHSDPPRQRLKGNAMKSTIQMLAPVLFVAALCAAPVRAQEVKAGDLVITQAWTRATPHGAKVGTGYLTIENKGSTPDRLLGGSTDVAGKVEVHEMAMQGGVMKMRPVDGGLTIDPGKTVKLAPGGYHLMMMDLKSPLKQGDSVPVTLKFEKAGEVKASLAVQGVGAQAPGESAPSGGMMKKMPDGMKM